MLNPDKDTICIPAKMIPSFRTSAAIERGVEKNILLKTWGGLGDQICAEPTLRYAVDTFKDCKVSLQSDVPELFSHIPFHEVFRTCDKRDEDKYFVFNTINDTGNLSWEFMSHMLVNCVDYPSLCAFRCMLPIHYKQLQLSVPVVTSQKDIVIHPGKHWQSKTFPKPWWDEVIKTLVSHGTEPVIIGADTDDNRGTVDVNTGGCLDLRNKLSVAESVSLLQSTKVLLTNDSSPMHMAASGNAYILFVATCKHPDYIMHWRNGVFGWRMENWGNGGIWDVLNYCPNKPSPVEAENVGEYLDKWLPDPTRFALGALARASQYV